MAIEVEAPDKIEIVASEAPAASEAEVEASPAPAQAEAVSPEAELLAAVTKGENGVAEALQQTRGAVFASLTTPTGAGPPASAVKAPSEEGLQDSSTQLTGAVEGAAEAGGAESEAVPAAEDPPQEETEVASEDETIQDEAESSIAETSPSPEPVASQESVEATRVAPPPDPEPVPVSEDISREGLTTNNPAGAGVEDGTQSNSASVLFLILGGVGAALILLRKRVAA